MASDCFIIIFKQRIIWPNKNECECNLKEKSGVNQSLMLPSAVGWHENKRIRYNVDEVAQRHLALTDVL